MTGSLTAQQSKYGTLMQTLERREDFRRASARLPSALVSEIGSGFLCAWRDNEDIRDCDNDSLVDALLKAFAFGLVPGHNNQCHIVPYKRRAALQIGYGGYVELAMRTGLYTKIDARERRAGEQFELEYGAVDALIHKPRLDVDRNTLDITHHYARAVAKNGHHSYVIWTESQMQQHRNQYGQSPAWKTAYLSMCRKTMLIALSKTLRQATRLQEMIEVDDDAHENIFTQSTITLEDPKPRLGAEADEAPQAQEQQPLDPLQSLSKADKARINKLKSELAMATSPESLEEVYKAADEQLKSDAARTLFGELAREREEELRSQDQS